MTMLEFNMHTPSVDWSERPWGRPIIIPVSHDKYEETNVAAIVDFRYHGLKVRGWRLVIRKGFTVADLIPPCVSLDYGGDTHVASASYFLNSEEAVQFKEDLAMYLDTCFLREWKKGMTIR